MARDELGPLAVGWLTVKVAVAVVIAGLALRACGGC